MKHSTPLAVLTLCLLGAGRAVVAAEFVAPTEARLDAARAEVAAAIAAVRAETRGAADWRRYLRLDELAGVADLEPDAALALLDLVHRSLVQDQPGLTRRSMRELRLATASLSSLLRAADGERSEPFARAVALLAAAPSEGSLTSETVAACRWLLRHGQRPDALSRLRADRPHPNACLRVAPQALQPPQRSERNVTPISGRLAGAPYSGTATSRRATRIRPVASESYAALQLLVDGAVETSTRSSGSGVTVTGGGTYDYAATIGLRYRSGVWSAGEPSLSGEYVPTPAGVSRPRGLFGEAARRRAAASYGSRSRLAGEQVRSDLMVGLRQGAGAAAASLNEALRPMASVLNRPYLETSAAGSYSTPDEIAFLWSVATPAGLAPAPAPGRSLPGSVSLLLHESALSQIVSANLPHGRAPLRRLMQRLTDEPAPEDAEDAWVTLPNAGAADVTLEPGRLTLVIHATQIEAEGSRYAPLDLVWRFELDGERMVADGPAETARTSYFPLRGAAGIRNVAARRVIGRLLAEQPAASIRFADLIGEAFGPSQVTVAATAFVDAWVELALEVGSIRSGAR